MRASKQQTLTVVAEISPSQLCGLRGRLADVQKQVEQNLPRQGPVPFGRIPTIHYARFAILRREFGPGDVEHPASLLFSIQHDGPTDELLDALVREAEAGLLEIYAHCQGFDAEAGPSAVRLRRYFAAHAQPALAFYVGSPGRTVERILAEEELARDVRAFASTLPSGRAPYECWRAIRESEPGKRARIAAEGIRRRSARRARMAWYAIVGGAALIGLASIAWAPVAAAWAALAMIGAALWLRLLEEQDADDFATAELGLLEGRGRLAEAEHESELARCEDLWPQNQLTVVTFLKRSILRRVLQRVVLALVALRVRYKFTRGLLHGVSTIHFAHWLLFDRGRRLLFVSNYDGSWSGYIDDFIAHAPKAVTAIWSHSVGCPKTRFLFFGGAADRARFKPAIRRHQVRPEVWYAAYPELSMEEIISNTELLEGLSDERLGVPTNRELTEDWLTRV